MQRITLKRGLAVFSLLSLITLAFWVMVPIFLNAATSWTPLTLSSTVTCVNGAPQLKLGWNNPNGAKTFTLYRSPNSFGATTWGISLITDSSVMAFNDTTVKSGKTYKYQVQAIGGTQQSRYSDILTVVIPECPAPQAPTPSLIPLTLQAQSSCVNDAAQVAITWNNPNSAQSFTLYRNPGIVNATTWGVLTTGDGSLKSFIDTKGIKAGTYKYQVQAIGGDQPSRYSDIASVTVPECTKPVATSTPVVVTPTTTPVTTPQPTSTPTTTPMVKDFKWGAYPGWETSKVEEFEAKVGSPEILAAFTHWGNNNDFPTYLAPYAKAKGRTLLVFWEASDHVVGGTNQPNFSYDAILAGNWDAYIKKFAEQARAYGGEVILIPFSEMNGNWNPWAGTLNGNTPAKAVAAYRHVHTVFGDVPNVKFGWAPNSVSVPDTPENAIEKYYPGDSYVDYVGVDGFNFGSPWLTFDQVFGKPLALLAKYNKPIYIFSFASAQGTQKADWMRDAFFVQMPKYPRLEGWVWFNQNKEKDWRIWSDTASLEVFKEVIK